MPLQLTEKAPLLVFQSLLCSSLRIESDDDADNDELDDDSDGEEEGEESKED